MHSLARDEYKEVPGEFYGTPKEIWGFRTRSMRAGPERVAVFFLRANAELFGMYLRLRGITLRKVIHSLGARHAIFEQSHDGLRIHRAYTTVHMDLRGRVYLAKSRAVPARLLEPRKEFKITREQAMQRARQSVAQGGRACEALHSERVWYPRGARLLEAWRVRVKRTKPRAEWIIHVNGRSGSILDRWDNLAASSGYAEVFDPNPVIALKGHKHLLRKRRMQRPPNECYRLVRLKGLSRSGYLTGRHVTTSPTPDRVRRADRRWEFRSHQRGFDEAMAYYHVDAAARYLEDLGYRGKRAILREPVKANVHGTHLDNSWYSPHERTLTFGTGQIDDAEDAETILHELGHAIQDSICPDFGQSEEAAAMGEGFGDYFAASFFADRKIAKYQPTVMSWDGLLLGLEDGLRPPCLRRVDSRRGYRSFVRGGDEHDNGVIWSGTLWEIRRSLGREAADRVILESHFQLDGFTNFSRGARAILDADSNLYRGRHAAALRRIFRGRRIPLE